jgi:hypothetical protein
MVFSGFIERGRPDNTSAQLDKAAILCLSVAAALPFVGTVFLVKG